MSWRIGKALLAMATATVLVLSAGWSIAAPSHGGHEIVGTWVVTVQLNNCSGTAIGGPFQSLLTFNSGETMIEDTTNPSFAAGQRGTGHGVWGIRRRSQVRGEKHRVHQFHNNTATATGIQSGDANDYANNRIP